MHIKLLYRKVLYVFLSLAIVIAPTIQQANAASNWQIDTVKSSGSRVILGASNGGYKSAINIPPNLAKITKFGMKGASAIGLIQIAAGLLNDGVDFVLDPANNRVNYRTVIPTDGYIWTLDGVEYGSKNEVCNAAKRKYSYYNVTACGTSPLSNTTGIVTLYLDGNETKGGGFDSGWTWSPSGGSYRKADSLAANKSISLSDLAPTVVANAQSSDSQKRTIAQKILQDVAKAAVVAGDYDADLLAGAVPTTETKPLIPAIPGAQAGDVDTGMTGGDVGAAADAARDAADTARKQAEAAKDAATAAADEAKRLNDEAKDLINTAIDQAIKDAATAAAAQAAKDAADAKSIADAAAAESARVAAEAARAAEKAVAAANEKAAAAEKAAADAAADASKSDVEKAAAQAAADAAKAEAAAAQARAEAAEKAAKDAAAAKPEAKPFELPAFCSWATVVCDYTVWVKEEYGKAKDWVKRSPDDTPAELMPIDDDPSGIGNIFQDKAEAGYVSFESQCPNDVLIPVELMGASQTLTISYTPFCHFASLIRYAVILGAWISGLLIVTGGRSRE